MHRGPFMHCFANSKESNWKSWKETAILTCGVLSFPLICCFKFVYDAAQRTLDDKADDADKQVPFRYVSGSNGMSLSRMKPIDSGLCILSTWQPRQQGFIAYMASKWNKGIKKDEEVLANKGMLWAYYVNDAETCGTLVMNTHTTTSTEVQYYQMEELKDAFKKLCDELMDKTKYFEFYLAGDFNAELKEEQLDNLMRSLNLKHISSMKKTNGPQTRCIDHIFAWRKDLDVANVEHKVSELAKPWESHCNACPGTEKSLSDHCWQCVTVSADLNDSVMIDMD